MRRTSFAAAAVAAGVLSGGLLAPANAAAAQHLVGRASCSDGGTIRLGTTLDDAGTRAVAHVSGAHGKHWAGQVLAGIDESVVDSTSMDDIIANTKKYVATEGGFTVAAQHDGAATNDSGAFFASSRLHTCGIAVTKVGPKQLMVTGLTFAHGFDMTMLGVAYGGRGSVGSVVTGVSGHRYRLTVTLAGQGGHVQERAIVRTAKRQEVDFVVRDFQRVASFARASLRVVDLTDRTVAPKSYAIAR